MSTITVPDFQKVKKQLLDGSMDVDEAAYRVGYRVADLLKERHGDDWKTRDPILFCAIYMNKPELVEKLIGLARNFLKVEDQQYILNDMNLEGDKLTSVAYGYDNFRIREAFFVWEIELKMKVEAGKNSRCGHG